VKKYHTRHEGFWHMTSMGMGIIVMQWLVIIAMGIADLMVR